MKREDVACNNIWFTYVMSVWWWYTLFNCECNRVQTVWSEQKGGSCIMHRLGSYSHSLDLMSKNAREKRHGSATPNQSKNEAECLTQLWGALQTKTSLATARTRYRYQVCPHLVMTTNSQERLRFRVSHAQTEHRRKRLNIRRLIRFELS